MRTSTRWSLPTALAAVLVGGSLVLPQLANADPELPPATAEELLADLAAAEPRPFSGTVEQSTDLGLPELPQDRHGGSLLTTLLGGTTTAQVWSDGPERSRTAILGELDEIDVIRNGSDVWVWNSDDQTVKHAVVPPHQHADQHQHDTEPPATALTPQDAATRLLALLDPTTAVTVDGTARVAGRDAYELVLTPRDAGTTVGEVRLAVDAGTSLPLRVQVTPRGSDDVAVESTFTDIDFSTPDAGVFEFTPPSGATVTEMPTHGPAMHGTKPSGSAAEHTGPRPIVIGEGWSSVLVLPGVPLGALYGVEDDSVQTLLDAFQRVEGDYGTGRLLGTRLISVLALDDGRMLIGMVPPQALQEAALDPAAANPGS